MRRTRRRAWTSYGAPRLQFGDGAAGSLEKKTDALDAYAMTNSNDVDGATVRLVAAKLRAEAGKETRFATRGAPEKVTPSREPLAARVLLATSLARDVL
mmetsp:Transcript_7197/g.24095  ORF Transcript_7197/g.24095 Transcript_7197/m.24095 type:complete len:99 (-) Transcript_7197:30-326(-)